MHHLIDHLQQCEIGTLVIMPICMYFSHLPVDLMGEPRIHLLVRCFHPLPHLLFRLFALSLQILYIIASIFVVFSQGLAPRDVCANTFGLLYAILH